MALKQLWGRIAYGAIFCVAVPILLALWSSRLRIGAPALHAPALGALLLILGGALMAGGMWALWRRGAGLPMNAFPPPRLVANGIYGLFPHPIYLGFVLACAGTALATGSAAGLWLATPLAALGCVALVFGYERPALLARHGVLPSPLFGPPPPEGDRVSPGRRLGVALWILVSWLVLDYLAVKRLGMPPDPLSAALPGEGGWPILPWTYAIYLTPYLIVPLAFLAAPAPALRRLCVQSWVGLGLVTLCHLCLPLVVPLRAFDGAGFWGRLLTLERTLDSPPVAAFPAYHVVWSCLAAGALAARGVKWRPLVWAWAAAVSVSCVTTGMHVLADVLAAWIMAGVLLHIGRVWTLLLRGTEWLANSWRCWRLGPVRVINHGIFGGLAGGTGVFIAAALAGPGSFKSIALIFACGIAGAALWAQLVEGSPVLLRPFGYYGGVLGIIVGGLAAGALGWPAWLALAALGCAGPWIQALGRLRCIMQGCCHGRQVAARHGICVHNPHSRVLALGNLKGVPIHATQLYSILGNVVIGCLLARLWSLGAAQTFIGGMYLILAGLARFMEEAYRGEPQTKIVAGLPIYQWLAVGSLLAGMLACLVPSPPAPQPLASSLAPALGLGLVYLAACGFAMGVDFPESRRRFSRLSG